MMLKQNRDAPFHQEWQKRAAASKIGKKLSPEHVQKARLNRIWAVLGRPKQEFTQESRNKLSRSIKAFYSVPENRERRRREMVASNTYSEDANRKRGVASKKMWANPNFSLNQPAHRKALAERMSKIMQARPAENCFSRTVKGFRSDLGVWFRSSWEANYARYLNWKGVQWGYETKVFTFPDGTTPRGWKPDFILSNGEIHEVKGWMYPRARRCLDLMAELFPDIVVVLIGEKEYKALDKEFRDLIPNWERRAKVKPRRSPSPG